MGLNSVCSMLWLLCTLPIGCLNDRYLLTVLATLSLRRVEDLRACHKLSNNFDNEASTMYNFILSSQSSCFLLVVYICASYLDHVEVHSKPIYILPLWQTLT